MKSELLYINEDNEVVISAELLSIDIFDKIWNGNDNVVSRKKIALVFYIGSMDKKNPFRLYEKKDRINEACKLLGIGIDKEVEEALRIYIGATKTLGKDFLRSAINNIYKLMEHLNGIDLDERDSIGKLIHNPKQYADILKGQTKVLKDLEDALKMVDSEMEGSNLRGGAKQEIL